MTVRDDDHFFADLAMFRDAPVPEAGAELRSLFAAVAAIPADEPARSLPVYKRMFTGLPSKIAAGALGALLAGTVGAGALTGTFELASSDDDPVVVCVEEASFEPEDGAGDGASSDAGADESADSADAEVADESAEEVSAVDESADPAPCDESDDAADDKTTDDDGDAEEADDTEAPVVEALVDPAAVPVPTSQSEAAQTHEFDEACGNHGAYVSDFAHTGEEAECATAARAGVEPSDSDGHGDQQQQKSEDNEAEAQVRSAAKSTKSDKGGR